MNIFARYCTDFSPVPPPSPPLCCCTKLRNPQPCPSFVGENIHTVLKSFFSESWIIFLRVNKELPPSSTFIYCLSFPPVCHSPKSSPASFSHPHITHTASILLIFFSHPDASLFGSLYTDPTLAAWPRGKWHIWGRVWWDQKHSSVLNQLINESLKKLVWPVFVNVCELKVEKSAPKKEA